MSRQADIANAALVARKALQGLANSRWLNFGGWYRSAWRPTAAWVCVLGLFVNLVVLPVARLWGFQGEPVEWGSVAALVTALVGLTVARSHDLYRGTAA